IKREALDSPSRVRRFFAEARALARLHHPQIVGVHGIGRMVDGRYFLVMDLVEGGATLSDLIKAGSVPFDCAARLVATVAEALERVCLTCLEKDATERWASAGAVAATLRSWLANPDQEDARDVAAGPQPGTAVTVPDGSGRTPRRDWAPDRFVKEERRPSNSDR